MTKDGTQLTPEEVKAEFNRHGVTIAEWARVNGYPPQLVYRILNGVEPKRGLSHKIAVQLGLKQGVASTNSETLFAPDNSTDTNNKSKTRARSRTKQSTKGRKDR